MNKRWLAPAWEKFPPAGGQTRKRVVMVQVGHVVRDLSAFLWMPKEKCLDPTRVRRFVGTSTAC